MKILFVIDTLGSGGAQRLLFNLANGLSENYQTSILVYNSKENFFNIFKKEIRVNYIKKTLGKGAKLSTLFGIWKHINNSDIVISFMPSSNIYCALSKALFNWEKILICNEVSINNILESKFKRLITNFLYFFATHIICNTNTQKNYLKKYNFLKNKTSTIFNGCDILPFNKRPKKIFTNKRLIIVGRIAYPKNGIRLLKALKLFHEKYKFLPIIEWAGRIDNSRTENNLVYNKMINFLDCNPKLNKSFKFVGEIKNITEFYKNSDGLISPSIYEGLPFVICEAMFSGCPVLASDIADNNIILGRNEERGFLCDPLSVKSILNGLEKLVFNPETKIKKMTLNARKFAEKNLANKIMVEKYKTLIEKFNINTL